MKIIDRKEFALQSLLAAKNFLGLNDWTLYFKWHKGEDAPEGRSEAACVEGVDYLRFNMTVSFHEWYVKYREEHPEDVAQCALHEILHVFTAAPLFHFEDMKWLKENVGCTVFTSVTSEMNILNEQMNVRLESALIGLFKASPQYAELFSMPCLSEDAAT